MRLATTRQGAELNINFVNMTEQDIDYLHASDPVLGEIVDAVTSGKQLSYDWLRANFRADNGLWETLNRGRAVLASDKQLDQYLHSYGPMISSQWKEICAYVDFPENAYRFVDYGCGQGLAGLLMFDSLKNDLFSRVERIVLIEPSPFALMRAAAIYRGIAPTAVIQCVCKGFDDLTTDDLVHEPGLPSIHVLSNVLDVPGYDHFQLFEKILDIGSHEIIAVSHDRDHNGGSKRIIAIKEAIEACEEKGIVKIEHSGTYQFQCGNGNQFDAIAWAMQVDVLQ